MYVHSEICEGEVEFIVGADGCFWLWHPELLKYDKLYESIEQSELLNLKESSPMIGFGLDYINVSERPDMNLSDNGKDIVMPMVSLSIPMPVS